MQLNELRGAVRSPIAAVENQHDILAAQGTQADVAAGDRRKVESGRSLSYLNAIKIGWAGLRHRCGCAREANQRASPGDAVAHMLNLSHDGRKSFPEREVYLSWD